MSPKYWYWTSQTPQIPLAVCERRHFIGTYGGKLWKFKRAAQGSRNGPLSWAGPILAITPLHRVCLQKCHLTPDTRRREHNSTSTIRPSPYPEHKNLRMTLWPLPCSFDRSWDSDSPFHKAQRGTSVKWIGAHIDIARDRVIVSIPEPKLKHFLDLV